MEVDEEEEKKDVAQEGDEHIESEDEEEAGATFAEQGRAVGETRDEGIPLGHEAKVWRARSFVMSLRPTSMLWMMMLCSSTLSRRILTMMNTLAF